MLVILWEIFEKLLLGFDGWHFGHTLGKRVSPFLREKLTRLTHAMISGNFDYYPLPCPHEMFQKLLSLGDGFYWKATGMSVDQAWARFRQTPESYNLIMAVDRGTGETEVAGYYVLFPLTKSGTEQIMNDSIEVGRNLREGDICQKFVGFTSLYISTVYGTKARARVATTDWLLSRILELKDTNGRLQRAFVRPTTPEGVAMFRTLTGQAPPLLAKIQKLDLNALNAAYMERLRRIRRLRR